MGVAHRGQEERNKESKRKERHGESTVGQRVVGLAEKEPSRKKQQEVEEAEKACTHREHSRT